MSRTVIFSLATAATIAIASLASSSADARGFGGFGGGGGRSFAAGGLGGRSVGGLGRGSGAHSFARGGRTVAGLRNPGRGGHPGHSGHLAGLHRHHRHWVFRDGIWIDVGGPDDGYGYDGVVGEAPVAPVIGPGPGPCTCLTKNYTSDGQVVFADLCTKESATAPVEGRAADLTPAPAPSSYAGRTYDDYLADHPQAARPAPEKN